jgi:hypothetical protein
MDLLPADPVRDGKGEDRVTMLPEKLISRFVRTWSAFATALARPARGRGQCIALRSR